MNPYGNESASLRNAIAFIRYTFEIVYFLFFCNRTDVSPMRDEQFRWRTLIANSY